MQKWMTHFSENVCSDSDRGQRVFIFIIIIITLSFSFFFLPLTISGLNRVTRKILNTETQPEVFAINITKLWLVMLARKSCNVAFVGWLAVTFTVSFLVWFKRSPHFRRLWSSVWRVTRSENGAAGATRSPSRLRNFKKMEGQRTQPAVTRK